MFRTHVQAFTRPQLPARRSLASAALLALLLSQPALATDFIYQGQLQEHGEAVNGLRSISLQVFDRARAGQALDPRGRDRGHRGPDRAAGRLAGA